MTTTIKYAWRCVGSDPSRWFYCTDDNVDPHQNVTAMVLQSPSGSWMWRTSKGFGAEYTCDRAMKAAVASLRGIITPTA